MTTGIDQKSRRAGFRRGDVVIVSLGVLTAIEFVLAVSWSGNGAAAVLFAMALVKAALIINYFMHFKQLWAHIATVWQEIVDIDPEAAE